MTDTDKKYNVLYKMASKSEGFTKSQFSQINSELIKEEDYGAANSIMVISIIDNDDGSRSYAFPSLNGITGKALSSQDKFNIWAILANDLSRASGLHDAQKDLCTAVLDVIKMAIELSKIEPSVQSDATN